MIYKYVTSREVIDKFFGDTGYNEDVPLADVVRWISEAIDKIGVKAQYVRKVAGDKTGPWLTIINYKAELPCDFFQLEQLAINGLPAVPANNTFIHMVGKDCCSTSALMQEVTQIYHDNFGNEFIIEPPVSQSLASKTPLEYDINGNFITTNIKTGTICMSYLAYPIDEEGFPMIPDDVYYLEAVASYIRRNLDYRLWRNNPNSQTQAVFAYSDKEWMFYVGSAKSAGLRMDPSTMESLVGSFVSMIPKLPKHNRYYKF